MIDNGDFPNTKQGYFSLSYELLCLLRWLVQHDHDKLKKIITQAVADGLKNELQKIDTATELNLLTADIQDNIVDFFGLMELLLLEAMNDQIEKKAREKNLMATIDKIDTSLCDDATVRFSIEKTTKKLDLDPNINAREQLFKELLKRWKPHNKNSIN
ncbi:MAG: hypothetical protein Q8Q25_03515 [bacterium]|nr:hypothetical protein [bacterium]